MSQEFIAGWLAMPAWAQAGVTLFVATFLAMIFVPIFEHRRALARFAGLAKAAGATMVPATDELEDSFELDRGARHFRIRRGFHDSKSRTWRGPRGHLLICETQLGRDAWKRHGVDISSGGSQPPLDGRAFWTGDGAFDARFTTWETGTPVREAWLDAPTRATVMALFAATPFSGTLWVRDGMLQQVLVVPKGTDAPTLDRLLRALATVAMAFERTADFASPRAS